MFATSTNLELKLTETYDSFSPLVIQSLKLGISRHCPDVSSLLQPLVFLCFNMWMNSQNSTNSWSPAPTGKREDPKKSETVKDNFLHFVIVGVTVTGHKKSEGNVTKLKKLVYNLPQCSKFMWGVIHNETWWFPLWHMWKKLWLHNTQSLHQVFTCLLTCDNPNN
jgi:hypothetical protein